MSQNINLYLCCRRSTTNSPHDKLEYNLDTLDEKSLENDISAFVTTMFWLLEKTRVEKTAMDVGQKMPPLLCAPFEVPSQFTSLCLVKIVWSSRLHIFCKS